MTDPKPRRPRQYRGNLPKPDQFGNVRPRVGGRKFTVGNIRDTSNGEMERRTNALKDFFEAQCEARGIDYWANCYLKWARKIERGETLVFDVSPLSKTDDEVGQGFASEDAAILSTLRKLGLEIASDDPKAIERGEHRLRTWLDANITRAVQVAVKKERESFTSGYDEELLEKLRSSAPQDPSKIETRTFHQALAAYIDHLKQKGKKRDGGILARSPENYIRLANQLKYTHEDFPIWKLDSEKLDELISYWRNRPVSPKTGNHISLDDAKHKLTCLWAVVRWLDESDRWLWNLPKKKFDKTPISLDQDRKKNQTRRVSKGTYTPEQLATIARQLDTFGKMMLGVCVNCGMQPAEIGRLEVQDFYSKHPETDEVGDWVIFNRPKTHEYGEWILFPEVAALLRWGIQRANEIGTDRIIVSKEGVPWYREDWSNPETRFAKWWQAVPTKNDKHEGVVTKLERTVGLPRLTFKTLRKILPNLVRPKFGEEIADLLNARKLDRDGNQNGRDTDRYADRLYDEGKKAILRLNETLRPFLDVLAEDEHVKHALRDCRKS